MEFKKKLSDKIKETEEVIYEYLPEEEGKQSIVMEAMNYSVKAGGKRLRPLFMMEFNRLFGGNEDDVKPFMAAMEFIHTYSLVHDDLPEMDNDEFIIEKIEKIDDPNFLGYLINIASVSYITHL